MSLSASTCTSNAICLITQAEDNTQISTETTQENESEENVDEALNNIMSGMFDDE